MSSTVEVAEPGTEAVDACPECDGELVDDDLETFCGECGLVQEVHALDLRPVYDDAGNRMRSSGANTASRHDQGIGNTSIGYVPGLESAQLQRMRRLHQQSMYERKQERGQMYVNSEIGRIATALGQGRDIEEQACTLYKQVKDENLALGRSLDGFAAACVLAILRVHTQPFTPSDVAAVTRVSDGEVENAYRTINQELGLTTPPPRVSTYIPRYASLLEVDSKTEALALEYAQAVDEAGTEFGGRAPSGLAGACLYHASDVLHGRAEGLNQVEVGDAIGKTDVTIRVNRKLLVQVLDE